jgi:hypothetical protein
MSVADLAQIVVTIKGGTRVFKRGASGQSAWRSSRLPQNFVNIDAVPWVVLSRYRLNARSPLIEPSCGSLGWLYSKTISVGGTDGNGS